MAIDPVAMKGPVLVTVAYFGLWYFLLLKLQRGTKYALLTEYAARGEQFDRYFGEDRRMLAADRVVINTQEQMVPFLASMWMFAALVSPQWATALGSVYVCLRAIYPLLLGRDLANVNPKRVFFTTGPAYLIVFIFLGASASAVL